MAALLLLPLLASLLVLPPPGLPAEPLPAPALLVAPVPGHEPRVALRCLAPLTTSVTLFLFYRRPDARGERSNFRNSSALRVEDAALPGLYSCAYRAPSHGGLAWSPESLPVPYLMSQGRPGDGCSSSPQGCSPAGTGEGVAGSGSHRRRPGTRLALLLAATALLLPRAGG